MAKDQRPSVARLAERFPLHGVLVQPAQERDVEAPLAPIGERFTTPPTNPTSE